MTLATKNGAIIVKDGKLAENCGCCGGWYCCPSSQCLYDMVTAVSATISASDYLKQTTNAALSSCSPARYQHASVGFLGSVYNGTFPLAKQSNGTWRHDFQSQREGTCTGSLILSWPNTDRYQLVFSYSVLSFVAAGTSSTPTHKELSEMTCNPSGFFGGLAGDCFSGYADSRGPVGTVRLDGGANLCSLEWQVNAASQNNNFVSIPLNAAATQIAFQPAWPGAGSVVQESGSNSASIAVSIS